MIEHTAQTEWIEGKGILAWLAFSFVELGAGTFIVSSLFRNSLGVLLGWLICLVLGGGFHLLYLGHPLRSWRMLISAGWKTSWISRGLYFVTFFLLIGGIHVLLTEFASPMFGIMIAADLLASLAMVYGGFALGYIHGIQLWNNGLLPVLFGVSGLWGGAGVTLFTTLIDSTNTVDVIEKWLGMFLVSYVFLGSVYLLSTTYRGMAGKHSVTEVTSGSCSLVFWVLVVGLGVIFPLGVAIESLTVGFDVVPRGFLYASLCLELLGDLSFRYCIFKCSFYSPLLSSTAY